MTTRIYNGGTADWFSTTSWSPSGVPEPGDVLSVASGQVQITAADVIDFGTLDAEVLTLGGSAGTIAVLDGTQVTFGSGFTLLSTGTQAFSVMELAGTSVFDGTMLFDAAGGNAVIALQQTLTPSRLLLRGSTTVTNGDTLTLDGGAVLAQGSVVTDGGTFYADGTLLVDGGTLVIDAGTTLSGVGTIEIANGGVVQIDGPTKSSVTIAFLDATGTLDLTQPQTFHSPVVGFQKGDGLVFDGWPARNVVYAAGTISSGDSASALGTVSVFEAGTKNPVATFPIGFATPSLPILTMAEDGAGSSFLAISASRTWFGGTGSWYDTAHWSTAGTVYPNSYPLAGDIVQIGGGTAEVSNDLAPPGPLDNATIRLLGTSVLDVTDLDLGAYLTITTAGTADQSTLRLHGTSTLTGSLTAAAQNGAFTLDARDGHLTVAATGTITDTTESSAILEGVITNDGQIVIDGQTTQQSGTIDGSGVIALGGTLVLYGSVAATQQLDFTRGNARLTIAPGARVAGSIEGFSAGDTIDLAGVTADAAVFDPDSGLLSISNAGTVVATLHLAGVYGADDFAVAADGSGGALVTSQSPGGISTTPYTLPVPALAATGGTVSLASLLTAAFGADFLTRAPQITLTSVGPSDMTSFSYWDPHDPSLSAWVVNGQTVAPDTPRALSPAEIADTVAVMGDQIRDGLTLNVANAFDSLGNAIGYASYALQNFDPSFSTAPVGRAPVAQDVLNAASAFSAAYTGVPNDNDCYFIAHAVAAAAGAPLSPLTGSTDPAQNVAGGFWRIAYAAGITQPAEANWSGLVEAGDSVRVGWTSGGQHSFTILSPLDPDTGKITVFDNADWEQGYEAIGTHPASYWTATSPDMVTIYRLDAEGLYLVNGVTLDGARIRGTTNNDLILPGGPDQVVTTGIGSDLVAGNAAVLNGATITDFSAGDMIDVTGYALADASVQYDAATGILALTGAGGSVAITLPTGLVGTWQISNDGGTAGLDGGSLGTLYTDLYMGVNSGAELTLVTCFAAGTRIATPDGDRAVEQLRVGESVCLADGRTQPIRWIGHRRLDVARHPDPASVRPVRIEAGAFGAGRPHRDLDLSPDHAVFVEGVLVPIKHLIDGAAIRQLTAAEMPEVTYWHVELPRHAVLLAEGLPAESYLDTGDRDRFDNAPVTRLHPDFDRRTCSAVWEAEGCAPLVVAGPVLAGIRARLAGIRPADSTHSASPATARRETPSTRGPRGTPGGDRTAARSRSAGRHTARAAEG